MVDKDPARYYHCASSGRLAQRESTAFTRQGSQVQSLHRPPCLQAKSGRCRGLAPAFNIPRSLPGLAVLGRVLAALFYQPSFPRPGLGRDCMAVGDLAAALQAQGFASETMRLSCVAVNARRRPAICGRARRGRRRHFIFAQSAKPSSNRAGACHFSVCAASSFVTDVD